MDIKSIYTEKVAGKDFVFCQSLEEINNTVSQIWSEKAIQAIDSSGVFYVAMGGDKIMSSLLDRMAENYDYPMWDKTSYFSLDDLYVPSNHVDSAALMFYQHLLEILDLESKNFNFIPFAPTIHRSITKYAADIRKHMALARDEMPEFDLIVLSLSVDGSLGAYSAEEEVDLETSSLVVSMHSKHSAYPLISLAMPVILNAKSVVVIAEAVSDELLKQALAKDSSGPFSYLLAGAKDLTIVTDAKASSFVSEL